MVLLEAMACGLPVITTDCGAIPEVVDNTALIVKQNNSESLYKGIKQMINNHNLRQKLSDMGLKRVHTYFDANKQSEKIYQLYNKIIYA